MDGSEPEGILGVSTCDKGDFSGYFIAVATEKPVPDGMEEYIIPETTYAMFESVGPMPESIQNTQQRAYLNGSQHQAMNMLGAGY